MQKQKPQPEGMLSMYDAAMTIINLDRLTAYYRSIGQETEAKKVIKTAELVLEPYDDQSRTVIQYTVLKKNGEALDKLAPNSPELEAMLDTNLERMGSTFRAIVPDMMDFLNG